MKKYGVCFIFICILASFHFGLNTNIGLNYPQTGPYSVQGLEEYQGAMLAVDEINDAGGILGDEISLIIRDSQSNVDVTKKNVSDLVFNENAKMVFGGVSSGVAITAGNICKDNDVLFFGTLTYSNATTGKAGHRYIFRECYNAWMSAKVLSNYLTKKYPSKDHKYFYITADYTWGWSTEESIRKFTNTDDPSIHRGIKVPFPLKSDQEIKRALSYVELLKPQVLVLVLFGKDMERAIRIASSMGIKEDTQIVVPNLTLGMADGAGPKVMEGVIGSSCWNWNIPYQYKYKRGIEFVEKYTERFGKYPSTAAASAYTIMWEYKYAVERAKSFNTRSVIKELENHKFKLLKDTQRWRAFDHQCIQSVYAVKCKTQEEVLSDPYQLDYFEVIDQLSPRKAARSKKEWQQQRKAADQPLFLEGF